MKSYLLRCWVVLGSALLYLSDSHYSAAQIVPDATLPVNSIVTPQPTTSVIEGGTRAGGNLFHSFREFSIPTGGEAFFNNALDVQNIFSRVTGGSISNIDGLIRANGAANLFLLNPNGIIFGPNAQLNIGGSFLASTASSVRFADGTLFSTTNPQTAPLLTISVPVGLQMGPNPGNIVVQGPGHNLRSNQEIGTLIRDNRPVGLQVASGQTLALLGGNLALEGGNLTAEGGRIELGSVAGETLVTLTPINPGMALSYPEIHNFQDISLSKAASVDASGAGGGDIFVAGRRVTLTDGSAILALTEGAELGGILSVRASEVVEAIGITSDGQFSSGLFADVQPGATGDGGNLTIETARLYAMNGAQVSVATFGAGKAGNLIVKATDAVELIGTRGDSGLSSGLFASAELGATGDGGNLTIETARLRVADGAVVSVATFGLGKGGNLIVKATDVVELSGTRADGVVTSGLAASVALGATGDGGNLTIETARLRVVDGAQVSVATFGTGKGGNLTVKATDAVELIGTSADGKIGSSLRALAPSGATGDGGNLTIETARLQVVNGATVSVRNRGEGKAGNLIVDAGSILLDNSGSLTAQTKAGGGSIELLAPTITLRRGSQITTDATGGESGGDIKMRTDFLQLREGSSITTNALGMVTGTEIKGGNISIDADVLAALENSDISANSDNFFGGQVFINSQAIFGTQFRDATTLESDITATGKDSAFSGAVTINTPEVDPSSGLIELPQNIVDVTGLVADKCSYVRRGSSFTVTGRGGIPPSPDDPLDPEAFLVDLIAINSEVQGNAGAGGQVSRGENNNPSLASAATPDAEIVEATGWFVNEKGQVVLTASAPKVTPTSPWLTTPTCLPSVR